MSSQAKRDFGSFHASNVDELINLPEEEYKIPTFPFELPTFDELKDVEFGGHLKSKYFFIEDSCTFLNHGAFGGVLRPALEDAQKWQIYIEKQPLRFFDRELLPHMVYVTRRLAKFVGCAPRDLLLITNATTGINTVVRSVNLQKGDTVFMLNLTYGAVKKLLRHVCGQSGATLQEEAVPIPLESPQQIVELVQQTLKSGTKLAVFDHIPSNTPFVLPMAELIHICRERSVPVLVDGAHALGQLPLDLRRLEPDFYVANCHKWLSSPKGAAILYVRRPLQPSVRPLVASHGLGSGFTSEFIWAGLHDYSPYLSLHTVLAFWEGIGMQRARSYMHTLARQAAELLCRMWESSLAAPPEIFGSMVLVGLPEEFHKNADQVNYEMAEKIQNRLYHDHHIEVPIKAVQGRLYVRLSAQIYNHLEEYHTLARAVLFIKDRFVQSGGSL